jgi:hypothetical protein
MGRFAGLSDLEVGDISQMQSLTQNKDCQGGRCFPTRIFMKLCNRPLLAMLVFFFFSYQHTILKATNQVSSGTSHWFGHEWKYRMPILICSSMGTAAIACIPVKIILNEHNFDFDLAKIDGGDMRFTDTDATSELFFWIEEYDNVCKEATIWVRIPSLPVSSYKLIYVYYNNPNALSKANRDSTFTHFYEDFSSVSIDWDHTWDTDNGADLSKDYYRIARLTKGYLVHDRESYYSDSMTDYFKQQVKQVVKPYSDHGFWDPDNSNWIKALHWNSVDGWTANVESHNWGYSSALEEGALMAAYISGNTDMDSLLALELEYMIMNVDSSGVLSGLDVNRRPGSYGRVLSSLALGSMYFKDSSFLGNVASDAIEAMDRMYIHISSNLLQSQSLLLGEVLILRGVANAVKAYRIYEMKEKRALADEYMQSICQKILLMQQDNGYIHIASGRKGRVQNQLKIDMALALAFAVDREGSYVEAIDRNLEWIIDNRFDRYGTGGVEWPPGPTDGDPFFEVHQTWFMITAKYLSMYTSSEKYLDELSQAFAFLSDDNFAHIDMYTDNFRNYDAFFSYRVIERNGLIQDESSEFKTFKGAYEIGASLWSLALNYDTYNPGYARLTSQIPNDTEASFGAGGMFTQEKLDDSFVSWDVKFRNTAFAGMYTGLFLNEQGNPIVLFDCKNGLNYMSNDNSVKVIYAPQLVKSRSLYTIKIYKTPSNEVRFVLSEDGNEIINSTKSDVMPFDSYYFGIFKESQKADDAPASIFIDNIHADQYVYPDPFVVPCPQGFVSLTAPQSLDIPIGTLGSRDHFLSGFRIENMSNAFLAFEYEVTSRGFAELSDNGYPNSLRGISPILSPGQSYSPPDARLIFPIINADDTQNVIYRVKAVQCPDIIDSCMTAISFISPGSE